MVKVTKVAAWDVDGELVATRELAVRKVREAAIREVLDEENAKTGLEQFKDEAAMFAELWDKIHGRVESAIGSI